MKLIINFDVIYERPRVLSTRRPVGGSDVDGCMMLWDSGGMPAAPPLARVDHLVIAVQDLAAAEAAYTALLGSAPVSHGTHPTLGTRNAIYGLTNCYLELLTPEPENSAPIATFLREYLKTRMEGLVAVALGTDDLTAAAAALETAGLAPGPITPGEAIEESGAARRWRSVTLPRDRMRGVATIVIEHASRDAIPRAAAPPADPSVAAAVDHVVIFSDDMEAALHLWRDLLGIPERWRREIPERGTVNVGLRLGGVTLELVAPLGNAAGERGERLWGVAYVVADCDAAVARARASGIDVTDTRTGLAPGTRIATVKWKDRLPTLLLQHTRPRGARPEPS